MVNPKNRIHIEDSTKKLLASQETINLNRELRIKDRVYYPKKHLSSAGFKSVIWKGVDEYGVDLVIKLATYEDYVDRPYLQEAGRSSKLKPYKQFAQLYDAGLLNIILPNGEQYKVVCFIEEWVDGCTVDEYILNYNIESTFLLNYVIQMCEILNILKENNLRHDDLHPGNVMIANPKRGEMSRNLQVKVIDMGSLKLYDQELAKNKDDFGNFIGHVVELHNRMHLDSKNRRRILSTTDKRFMEEVVPLINSMLEEDPQISLNNPEIIVLRFQQAYMRAKYTSHTDKVRLVDPFDYISAEHIADDELLVKLFADSCPWIAEVTSPNPMLLTGPRGCGKSMVFRWMSLKALLYRGIDEIGKSQIAGFYVSCSADMRNRFGWINSLLLAKEFESTIVHYFNLLLCKEIIITLEKIAQRDDRDSTFGFSEFQEEKFHEFLTTKLNIEEKRMLSLQGVSPIEHIKEIVEYEMSHCYELFLRRRNVESSTPISFISDLTKHLKYNISYFSTRQITFLIDDYSIHRISEPIQNILNPIIWDRQSTHIFKLSSEKYGTNMWFKTEKGVVSAVDNTREFIEIDCGKYYISLVDNNMSRLIQFSKDLLDHRLRLAGYKGYCQTLIGNTEHEEGSLAKSLRENPKRQTHYHGIKTIAELCSGDISALLEIYRVIFSLGKVNADNEKPISHKVQNDAIESVSKRFFGTIPKYYPYGKDMYNICLHFGTLCRKIMYDSDEMEIRGKKHPKVTGRIEVDQDQQVTEEWTEEHESLMKELIRRSIFIELEPSRGRNSLGPTIRWQLRRIYCPTFALAMVRNDSLKWSLSEFKYFILCPKEKCESEWNNKWKKPQESPEMKSGQTRFIDNGEWE